MKFNFENFGYVDKGTVEVGDLTLICGPNNVGKTYLTYAIYGFIKNFTNLVHLSITPSQIDTLKDEGSLTIDLTLYEQQLAQYIKSASEEFSKGLADYFSTSDDFFENSKIEFSFDDFCISFANEFKGIANFGQRETFLFDKASDSKDLSVAIKVTGKSNLPNSIIDRVVSDVVSECLFSGILPKPFAVTSERTDIVLFYKELDINRNKILEHLTDSDEVNPITLINSMTSRYARPIQDNIDVVRDYETINKRKSFIREDKQTYKPVLDALQDLLGGTFKAIDKQVLYQPKKERNRSKVAIPVYIASSAIKSLFLIDLYINCIAEKKGLLIIDEPELNLHPDNQRKMASLLARLVNAGIRVLVTTHSDYLIRELNNRIMLSNNDIENKEAIMKNASIVTEDILRPEQVKAFSIKNDHSIQEIPVDKYGMNMQIFDELIAEANSLSDNIYYNIKDE